MRRAWGIATVAGLVLAAALILVPRAVVFAPQARDSCEERTLDYSGLFNDGGGRYGDPVPGGARCIHPSSGGPITDVELRFFADSSWLNALLGWTYRIACIVLPLGLALVLGMRLSSAP